MGCGTCAKGAEADEVGGRQTCYSLVNTTLWKCSACAWADKSSCVLETKAELGIEKLCGHTGVQCSSFPVPVSF